jgi:uncharacterized protein DUF222/HNH endonuclease
MCEAGQPGPAAAMAAVTAGLTALAAADMTGLTQAEHAALLRALGAAEAQAVAARSAVLAAFDTARGHEADGAGSSRSWLRWQTRITPQAASGAAGWMRRLRGHPDVAAALAAGAVSPSWARCICDWTARLAVFGQQQDADKVLLAAAAGGAELADLAGLAEEIVRRCAGPDKDRDGEGDGFRDRHLRLAEYWQGSGLLEGNLTPECAAALRAVLDALNGKAGPEDHRSAGQRDHDALCEALTRLLAARCLPERGGQPVQVQLHMTLDQLLGQPGAAGAVTEWAGYAATAPPGTECDATIVPVVTGHLDPNLLDHLATALLEPATTGTGAPGSGGPGSGEPGSGERFRFGARLPAWAGPDGIPAWATPFQAWKMAARPAPQPGTAARELILTRATRLLSGPHGLAAWLRHQLTDGPAAAISQVLDIGIPTEIIPPHLRRAVVLRDRHCSFPGCFRPPAACQVHHITPRSEGGVTSLDNCALLCPFHHLIAIHRWGWQFRLNPDSTKTVTSPDGRIFHTHSPPTHWAA